MDDPYVLMRDNPPFDPLKRNGSRHWKSVKVKCTALNDFLSDDEGKVKSEIRENETIM